mmetsp:Transcript_20186/g.47814  ORF Transcript_20186/g.47814 Transcript_20186/m.47814 type:complete len:573 (+) Transcript_20186:182-1900(+)
MHKYRLIAKKGEGTFSEVLKAQCVKNGKMTAIKCMKSQFESEEQVNNLREIQALRRLSPHPGIIKLVEVLYEQPTGRLALVFELMDMNIYELIRGRRQYLPESRIKSYMYQLIKAMDHMHRNGIFHRDIKPENILIADDTLKLADFGSCRGIYSKQPYTEYISTRWYRAPECLLTDGYYNYKMDLWGVGCVFFEIVSLYPLFPGNNELDQIHKIHNILGTPGPEILEKFKRHATHMELNFPPKEGSGISKLIPHALEECNDLILKLLAYNPEDRLSARQALRHTYVKELREMDKKAKRDMLAQNQQQPVPSSSRGPTSGSDAGGSTRRRDDGSEAGGKTTQRGLPTIKQHMDGLVLPQPSMHGFTGSQHLAPTTHQAPSGAAASHRYPAEQREPRDGPQLGGGGSSKLAGGGLPELTSNPAMRGYKPTQMGQSKKHGTYPKKTTGIKTALAVTTASKYGTGGTVAGGIAPSTRQIQVQGSHNFTTAAPPGGGVAPGGGRNTNPAKFTFPSGGAAPPAAGSGVVGAMAGAAAVGGVPSAAKFAPHGALAIGPTPPVAPAAGGKYTSPYSQKKS